MNKKIKCKECKKPTMMRSSNKSRLCGLCGHRKSQREYHRRNKVEDKCRCGNIKGINSKICKKCFCKKRSSCPEE